MDFSASQSSTLFSLKKKKRFQPPPKAKIDCLPQIQEKIRIRLGIKMWKFNWQQIRLGKSFFLMNRKRPSILSS